MRVLAIRVVPTMTSLFGESIELLPKPAAAHLEISF